MDINETVISFLDGVKSFNFDLFAKVIVGMIGLLWAFVVLWVWNDASERSSNILFRIFVTVFVAPFNFVGLLIYYLIRPKRTIQELYWADLERRYLIYETADLQDCAKCGEQLMPGYNVCPRCANVIKVKCESCEMMIDKDHKYCPYCGEQRLKRVIQPESLSNQIMEQNIEEQKAEAIEAVTLNKTRYATKDGLATKVGSSVIKALTGFTDSLSKGVKNGLASSKAKLKEPKLGKSISPNAVNEEALSKDGAKKASQKASRRKARKRKSKRK